MRGPAKNILITGLPGCGKTTLIRKLAIELREFGPCGFFTEEIREQGVRKGFQLASLDGRETGTLAHVDIRGPHRVGRYGVDLGAFEQFLESLRLSGPSPRLVMIDEIGKMECFSSRFRDLVASLLDGPALVVATIALKAGGFVDEVKCRKDVHLVVISERDRGKVLADLADRIRAVLASRGTG